MVEPKSFAQQKQDVGFRGGLSCILCTRSMHSGPGKHKQTNKQNKLTNRREEKRLGKRRRRKKEKKKKEKKKEDRLNPCLD